MKREGAGPIHPNGWHVTSVSVRSRVASRTDTSSGDVTNVVSTM
jgi:hypothetical protein